MNKVTEVSPRASRGSMIQPTRNSPIILRLNDLGSHHRSNGRLSIGDGSLGRKDMGRLKSILSGVLIGVRKLEGSLLLVLEGEVGDQLLYQLYQVVVTQGLGVVRVLHVQSDHLRDLPSLTFKKINNQ